MKNQGHALYLASSLVLKSLEKLRLEKILPWPKPTLGIVPYVTWDSQGLTTGLSYVGGILLKNSLWIYSHEIGFLKQQWSEKTRPLFYRWNKTVASFYQIADRKKTPNTWGLRSKINTIAQEDGEPQSFPKKQKIPIQYQANAVSRRFEGFGANCLRNIQPFQIEVLPRGKSKKSSTFSEGSLIGLYTRIFRKKGNEILKHKYPICTFGVMQG